MSICILLDIGELKFREQRFWKWHFLLNCKNVDSDKQLNYFYVFSSFHLYKYAVGYQGQNSPSWFALSITQMRKLKHTDWFSNVVNVITQSPPWNQCSALVWRKWWTPSPTAQSYMLRWGQISTIAVNGRLSAWAEDLAPEIPLVKESHFRKVSWD